MSVFGGAIRTIERWEVPDAVTLAGISFLCGRTRKALATETSAAGRSFAGEMSDFPIALATDEANQQHYEIPPEFFDLILGERRKYSCCYYETETASLNEAEVCALERTCANADIKDGHRILELGCGWGSLTLWLGETYPASTIHAVSNSASQRAFIEAQAQIRGLTNITVKTADMNVFDTTDTYDRVVSVEMFEHMSNWWPLFENVTRWMAPEGRFFMHVFSHRTAPYRFDHTDDIDWIGQHFFTGGIMPSHDLVQNFGELLEVEEAWRWSGTHYERTARHWLQNFDANQREIDAILSDVYGADAKLWRRRWRLFFLATMGLFGHADGAEWGVSHYRLKRSG